MEVKQGVSLSHSCYFQSCLVNKVPQVPKCLSARVPQWPDVLQVPMCPRTWVPKCPSALSAWLVKCSWSARVPQVLECPSAQVPFYYLQFYYYSSRITESLLIIFYQPTRALCMWKVTSHFQLWKEDLKKKVIRATLCPSKNTQIS